MINIIDYIMASRRTVVFLMIIIISIGLLTYANIAKDAEPDIDIPLIYVGVLRINLKLLRDWKI